MFLGEQLHGGGVRVIFPGKHEVDEKRYEADGQQNFSHRATAGRDYAR